MLIYKDIFTGDEVCSDSFPMKLVDDFLYEFEGKHSVRKAGEIVIEGMNPSAEGEDAEGGDDPSEERGIDIMLNHNLQPMDIYTDKKMFLDFMKEYVKKLTKKIAEDKDEAYVNEFKTKVQAWVKSLVAKDRFKQLEFFVSESERADEGQLVILEYREVDGNEKPIVMLLKDGLEVEKC
jgi:hypothetical protein